MIRSSAYPRAAMPAARPHSTRHRLGRPPCATGALTARESELVDLVCEGHNNESIGHQLDITEWTAKRHLSNIFEKLGVNTRTELAIKVLNARHAAELAIVRSECDIFDIQSN
jgi:DNA-binding NarL/FixJ family response regulator